MHQKNMAADASSIFLACRQRRPNASGPALWTGLALPEERHPRRVAQPQTDWDILHGLILAFRRGDIPVARAYLDEHAPQHLSRILDLLDVWAAEMAHPDLKREAETLRFGLRPMAA